MGSGGSRGKIPGGSGHSDAQAKVDATVHDTSHSSNMDLEDLTCLPIRDTSRHRRPSIQIDLKSIPEREQSAESDSCDSSVASFEIPSQEDEKRNIVPAAPSLGEYDDDEDDELTEYTVDV